MYDEGILIFSNLTGFSIESLKIWQDYKNNISKPFSLNNKVLYLKKHKSQNKKAIKPSSVFREVEIKFLLEISAVMLSFLFVLFERGGSPETIKWIAWYVYES